MAEDVLKQGDTVQAKWPGSRRYEKATIVRIQGAGKAYEVKYLDGSTSVVKHGDVKPLGSEPETIKPSTPKPPARARSRSPSKSPARTTSPKKGRSISRGRKTERSQSRSPARTKPATPAKARSRSRSVSKTTKGKTPIKTKSPTRAKSPAKGKSQTRAKSPAKGKSPTRAKSPAKTKSPSKPKTPRTPSPGRKAKPKEKTVLVAVSVERPKSPARKTKELFSSPEVSPTPVRRRRKVEQLLESVSPVSPRRRGRPPTKNKDDAELVPLLTKLSKIQTLDKVIHADINERKIYSTRSRIAQKVELAEPKIAETDGTRLKVGFVGIALSTIAIFALPAITVFLALSCVRKRTTVFAVPQPPKASQYFSWDCAFVFLAFAVIQAPLNALPIGKVVRGFVPIRGRPTLYRLNGLYCLLISAAVVGGLGYFGQPLTFVHDHFFKLSCTAVAFSFFYATVHHVRSLAWPIGTVSQYGNTGCTPYDFYHGRELNPGIGRTFDFKMMAVRSAYIGWILVNSLLLYKAYLLYGCVHYELALTAGAQILFALHLLYKEELILSTATIMHGGLGFGLVHSAYAMAPFTFTIPTYYLVHQKPHYPLYCLAGMVALYFLALWINRSALLTKMLVKRNPEDPAVTGVKFLVSGDIKKPLVASGSWGFVRHPNYISEILMFIAWTLPCGFQSNVPYMPILLITLLLVRRTFQVEAIMARNYPAAFNQYKHRVPYRLIPYVF